MYMCCVCSRDVPIRRFRSVSATDPVVLTNIELTDIGSINRSDTIPILLNYIHLLVIAFFDGLEVARKP